MSAFSTMRRVWIALSFAVAALSLYPAISGYASWWMPGVAATICALFVLEPYVLRWELRKRGEELQITDDGVMRRLARGDSEYVSWRDLREVSIVLTQGVNLTEEWFFVLAGTGTSGVIIGQALASKYDLVSHLAKLPGFDHRNITNAMQSTVNQRYLLWRAAPIEGDVLVLPPRQLN